MDPSLADDVDCETFGLLDIKRRIFRFPSDNATGDGYDRGIVRYLEIGINTAAASVRTTRS